ncbi:MAG TPA: UrcA family protein [Rhizomicrobium sp.]
MAFRSSWNPLRTAMLAGTVGLMCAASAANAQDTREVAYGPDGTETVIVHAPYDRIHHYPDGTATLSREVSYADLDLTTRDGRHELRTRVRDTARDVCTELRDRTGAAADPLNRMDLSRCERDAFRDAMGQAHEAVADARDGSYSEAAYRGDGDDN